MPINMFPFAIDGGGFPFCISLDDEKIHFFNLESEEDILINSNFDGFINKIISE